MNTQVILLAPQLTSTGGELLEDSEVLDDPEDDDGEGQEAQRERPGAGLLGQPVAVPGSFKPHYFFNVMNKK